MDPSFLLKYRSLLNFLLNLLHLRYSLESLHNRLQYVVTEHPVEITRHHAERITLESLLLHWMICDHNKQNESPPEDDAAVRLLQFQLKASSARPKKALLMAEQ